MALLIPKYPAFPDFQRITRALLDVDQFDDWLPDPIYYRDQLNALGAVTARLQSLWQRDSIELPAVEKLQLPRESGATVPGVALPLDVRLCAHAVIAMLAPRVSPALPRDKVYGFRYLKNGSQTFDAPGEELRHVFDLVTSAANAAVQNQFRILDVVEFNASAKPAQLATTLQSCGARADEANFLRELAALGGGGLASIDDAFAFAYNFYLQPVDGALFAKKHNFFRYRDEYYTFTDAAENATVSALQTLGLRGRSEKRSAELTSDNVGEPLIQLPEGTLSAEFFCKPEDEYCSDKSEVVFRTVAPDTKHFAGMTRGPNVADAVTLVPYLRDFHRRRSGSVLLAPPFAGQTPDAAKYRAMLDRESLRRALRTASQKGSTWQAGWAATLLSDTGALTADEVTLLLDILNNAAIGATAKAQVRISLARSSTLPAERFWSAKIPATSFGRRAALVAARHLSRRDGKPWKALLAALGNNAEKDLVLHLQANIVESHS